MNILNFQEAFGAWDKTLLQQTRYTISLKTLTMM